MLNKILCTLGLIMMFAAVIFVVILPLLPVIEHPALIAYPLYFTGLALMFAVIYFDKKSCKNLTKKPYDYPRPTSGDQIKSVYTPIEYVRAGEKLLQQMREEQDKQNG